MDPLNHRIALDVCRNHHYAIRALIDQVPLAEPLDEQSIVKLLMRVEILLGIHLKLEDDVLYPALEKGAPPALGRKAERYREHMVPIGTMFTDVCRRWQEAGAITAHPARFIDEWGSVCGALRMRMDSEDEDLYALTEQYLASSAQNDS